ncbi:MAG: acylphosphatase [Puniceicoccales bacterium]|nr:acylphosphatase [Puniceicoccales bacterium]
MTGTDEKRNIRAEPFSDSSLIPNPSSLIPLERSGSPAIFYLSETHRCVVLRDMPYDVFHKDVWFSGRVQGVGFRAHTLHVARGYEVTGAVKNLLDGRVFLQVEGTEKEVSLFLLELRRQLADYIREVEEHSFWGASCFNDFCIH